MKITYAYHSRHKAYLTLIDGYVAEAHRDLADFLDSLETLHERLHRSIL